MKIAIIFPNLHAMPQTLDLGIGYLATYISERTSHQVKIIDLTFHSRNWRSFVKKEIEDFKPDVIGFSSFSILWDCTKLIANYIPSFYKKVPIIVGGYQAIMLPEETIAEPLVDIICTGEGEYTISEYLDCLENKHPLNKVLGIWYKENDKIIKNPHRPIIKSLDSLPYPNWDLFDDIDKYLFFLGRLYVIGTRGCPYNCSFCAESVLDKCVEDKRFREKSPASYVKEIEYQFNKYKNRGMKGLHLFDTVFTYNEKWLEEWALEYKKRNLHNLLPYTVFARPDEHNLSEKKISILADSGCVQVRMGIESGDSVIRDQELNKTTCSNNTIDAIIKKLNAYNILVKTYAIIGFPHDTKASIIKTIKFANNPLTQTQFILSYTAIPGTPLAKKVKQMNSKQNLKKYSFHFSGGAQNDHYGKMYIHIVLLFCYIFFGFKQFYLSFKTSPIKCIRLVSTRIVMGLKWGNPLLLTTLYSIIHAEYWEGWQKAQQRFWLKQKS